jgi:hypothetical protein
MRASLLLQVLAVTVLGTTIGHAQTAPNAAAPAPAFQSDAELTASLDDLSNRAKLQHALQLIAKKCGDEQAILRSRNRLSDSDGTAVIQGRIAASWGAPIAAAQVRLSGTDVGHITATDGTYRIAIPADSLPKTGNLTLQAEGLGFTPKSLKLSLSPDETVVVDFVLCPAALKLRR